MRNVSRIIQSSCSALCFGAALVVLLLAGCDSSAVDGGSDLLPLADASSAQARLPLCHVNGQGEYIKITVAEAAYQSHLDHGDAGIGDPVPGTDGGYVFDEDCQPEEVVIEADCPCFDAEDLDAFANPEFSNIEDGVYWTTSVEDLSGFTRAGVRKDADGYSCSWSSKTVRGAYTSKGEAETCRALLFEYQ